MIWSVCHSVVSDADITGIQADLIFSVAGKTGAAVQKLLLDATNDHQFIHVDPELAKSAPTPWDTTIAHGFLTLSLVSYMSATSGFMPAEMQTAVNYGSDKVRFMEAVPVDSKIRGRFILTDAQYKKNGRWLVKTTVTIEIEGVEKPAAVIETLTLYIVKE